MIMVLVSETISIAKWLLLKENSGQNSIKKVSAAGSIL